MLIFLKIKQLNTKFFVSKRYAYVQLPVLAHNINEIWGMNVAYVDKIALSNDGTKLSSFE